MTGAFNADSDPSYIAFSSESENEVEKSIRVDGAEEQGLAAIDVAAKIKE